MISRTFGHVGVPIEFRGTAYDFGHAITAVEFSLDSGKTWTSYETRETNDYQIVSWRFAWTPERAGFYVLSVRSVSSSGRTSPEAAYAEILVDQYGAEADTF